MPHSRGQVRHYVRKKADISLKFTAKPTVAPIVMCRRPILPTMRLQPNSPDQDNDVHIVLHENTHSAATVDR